jgi:hypothetical protein
MTMIDGKFNEDLDNDFIKIFLDDSDDDCEVL